MKILKGILFFIVMAVLCSMATGPQPVKVFSKDRAVTVHDTVDTLWAEVDFEASAMINRMAYADTANFMHTKIYPCARCFLRPEVADALEKANGLAKEKNLRLVLYDCYRPYSLQKTMYDIVNDPRYVAPPGKGSNHNRGAAVDISLADENCVLLDMGGGFDDFSDISHYGNKNVSKTGRKNRRMLRKIMVKAGFTPLESEWWHFDYKKKSYENAGFQWDCP